MNKYFITRSKYHADAIAYMTGESYMKFNDKDGLYFSFVKTGIVLDANKAIQDFRHQNVKYYK